MAESLDARRGERRTFSRGRGGPRVSHALAFAWAAAVTEFVGGLCIALGIGTRIAATFAAFTMFVAAFFRHRLVLHILVELGVYSPAEEVVESWGSPERAATHLLIFLALVLLGGGHFSLDRLVKRSD